MSDTVRKLARDLVVGDEVVGYGVLTHIAPVGDLSVRASRRLGADDYWPSDAEVTVKVKPRKWQRTITQTTDDCLVAECWRNGLPMSKRGTVLEYGEVVEL